jgi:flagellar biosynthetic protein FliR
MTWEFAYSQLLIYIMVFCRMAGILLFNPLLARRNVPVQLTMSLCLGLSLLISPALPEPAPLAEGALSLVLAVGAELVVGLIWGLIFQTFYYMLFMAGDVIDMSLGLSMAKVLDRNANIQMSLSGNLFTLIFVLFLFTTNSHLALIRLAAASYEIIGLGGVVLGTSLSLFMIEMFLQSFSLAIRLALPFLAASFTVEVTMGILMKLVPQINVFSIHFQIKVILGLLLLFAFAVPVSGFVDNYITIIFQQMEQALGVMG